MGELVYRPLTPISLESARVQLEKEDEDELLLLSLRIGEYAEYWKPAQDICVKLMEHSNPAIRANAAVGLAYIARNHRKLDKRIVKRYLLKELRENKEFNWRIRDAIEDINLFLKWNLASKHDVG
ncbi:MAG: hypothetical protein K2N82_01255 [Lachnospiraceae bacterium]|nr:hypothetical protein [Lachnospiraceae bacterium]